MPSVVAEVIHLSLSLIKILKITYGYSYNLVENCGWDKSEMFDIIVGLLGFVGVLMILGNG